MGIAQRRVAVMGIVQRGVAVMGIFQRGIAVMGIAQRGVAVTEAAWTTVRRDYVRLLLSSPGAVLRQQPEISIRRQAKRALQ
jgi:hypothetical protein